MYLTFGINQIMWLPPATPTNTYPRSTNTPLVPEGTSNWGQGHLPLAKPLVGQ